MNKILKKWWSWLLLFIGVIAIFYGPRFIEWIKGIFSKTNSDGSFAGVPTSKGGTSGKNIRNKRLRAIPKKAVHLINIRSVPRKLLKLKTLSTTGEVPEFELSEISVGPGGVYGLFEPNKKVMDHPAVFKDVFAKINGKLTTKKYTFLRVSRGGQYYYIAMDNAGFKDKTEGDEELSETLKEQYKEQAPIIAKALYEELHKFPYTDEERVKAIIRAQTDYQLKLVAKAYERMYGRTLIEDLSSELNGSVVYSEEIQRIGKILNEG